MSKIIHKGILIAPDNLDLNRIYDDEETPVEVIIDETFIVGECFKFKITIKNPKYPDAEPIIVVIDDKM